MKTNYGPPSTELLTLADVEEFLNVQEAAVIGFFETETDLKTMFRGYADLYKQDYRFGHSAAADVLSKYQET